MIYTISKIATHYLELKSRIKNSAIQIKINRLKSKINSKLRTLNGTRNLIKYFA